MHGKEKDVLRQSQLEELSASESLSDPRSALQTVKEPFFLMSCPSWQWHTLPVAPLWRDLGRCSRTVVIIKLRRTTAFDWSLDRRQSDIISSKKASDSDTDVT